MAKAYREDKSWNDSARNRNAYARRHRHPRHGYGIVRISLHPLRLLSHAPSGAV